jgi:probable phosphoglycerate mutase
MLYFIRHGESEANVRHVFAGQRDDSPLTDVGKQQARDAAEVIGKSTITFNHICASPLLRTRQTAEIIAAGINFPLAKITYEARIAEYDMGALTSTPLHSISSQELTSAPGAEDTRLFRKRIQDALAELRMLPGNTLVVSHAGVGRMIEAARQGLDPTEFYSVEAYPNGQLVVLEDNK